LIGLFGSHGDALEEVLDEVSPFVEFAIERQRLGPARMLRDDGLGAALVEIGDDAITVEALSAISPPKSTPSSSSPTPTVSKRWRGGNWKRARLPSP
jgi:hypothetical protein